MAFPVSERWERFIRRGFHPITVVDVRFPGEGIVFSNLPISSGSVNISRGRSVRTQGNITVADPSLFPAFNDDSPIAPYGAELIIKTGIAYPRGAALQKSLDEMIEEELVELVPMGIFMIEEGSGSEKQGNVTELSFFDRGKYIDEMEHVRPKDYGGMQAFDALVEIIQDPDPWIDGMMTWDVIIDVDNLENYRLPNGTTFDTGRWTFIEEICEALGAEAFFGRDGNCYVFPVPGITTEDEPFDPDWIVDAGKQGVLIDVSRSVSRPEANGVVMTGSADSGRAQPFAFVTDDDPNSRTFYGGPLGKVVKRFDNSDLTTTIQCERAARAKLRDTTGLQRSVDFETFGNPAMDAGDIIAIRSLSGPDETHMLDGYSYDFRTAQQSCNTRSIQFTDEDE